MGKKAAGKPKAKAAAKMPTREAIFEDKAGKEQLESCIEEVFKCYDEDTDGQIERVEFLNAEEMIANILGEDFGVKERKAAVNWFKAAGAEGTPTDGMYLSRELWVPEWLKKMAEKSEMDPEKDPGKLAEWIYASFARTLWEKCYPAKEAAASSGDADGAGAAGPPKEPPTYPLTIPLADLAKRIKEAADLGRMVLLLASGLVEVETYLSYQMNISIDCKKVLGEVLIKKEKTKEEAQEEMKEQLMKALDSHQFCKPLHLRMANTAFEWKNFIYDEGFPAEIFSGSEWSAEEAHKRKLISDAMKMACDCDPSKFKDYQTIISSTFDLAAATEHLAEKIPHYDELAILVVDPASCGK